MGKLFIHIGPPKTGTTSLQYYWNNLKISGFYFLGVIQPGRKESVASNLYKQICSKENDNLTVIELIESIESILLKNDYVIISEEMFVVEQFTISYKEKLKKLFEITRRFDPTILYCVRNVEQVYFSYYTEIFASLPRVLQNSFSKFQESIYSDCYQYKKMYLFLSDLGFKKVNIFLFEDLVNDNLKMSDILGIQNSKFSFPVNLDQKNSTIQKNRDLKVTKQSIVQFILSKIYNIIPKKLKGTGLGSIYAKQIKKDNYVSLRRESIEQKYRDQYLADLKFINDKIN